MRKPIVIFLAIVAIAFIYERGKKMFSSSENDNDSSCEYANSILEVKTCIIGTWISNPTGEIWSKIEFSNGSYKLWNATPSSGSWRTEPSYSGTYSIAERRYSDTGKKYVDVSLNGSGLCNYSIIFDGNGASLVCGGSSYYSIDKGDINPWN